MSGIKVLLVVVVLVVVTSASPYGREYLDDFGKFEPLNLGNDGLKGGFPPGFVEGYNFEGFGANEYGNNFGDVGHGNKYPANGFNNKGNYPGFGNQFSGHRFDQKRPELVVGYGGSQNQSNGKKFINISGIGR